jgi:galactokinase
VARAPGRVNLIGEHTDYSGGRVLPAAISLATTVAVRLREDGLVRGRSRERGNAQASLAAEPAGTWLDYVRGAALQLVEAGRIPASGFDVYVSSEIPGGAGLSSSAALLVASALALAEAGGAGYRQDERFALAQLCQRAENEFVGVPSGLMDEFASALGRAGAALLLDCTELAWRAVPFPESLEILVFDTEVRRELRGGAYETRVLECERARQQAAGALGRPLAALSAATPADLPALEPALDPLLFRRLRHVATENERVERLATALGGRDRRAIAALLYASHESLAADYEVSWPEADLLVALSRELPGIHGARMTGAGHGGCTLHLVDTATRSETVLALHAAFARQTGRAGRSWPLRPAPGATLI